MVAVTAAAIHGVLGITPTWERLEVTPHLPADWPRAEADVLYKGRRHRVTIEGGKVQVQPLEQVIDLPLLWVMDFNLRTTPAGIATTSNVELLGPYGDRVVLKNKPGVGKLSESALRLGRAGDTQQITVAAELHGGQVTATVETSNDGFKTAASLVPIKLSDGVVTYPLDSPQTPSRQVRVVFELRRVGGSGDAATPVIDGFRISGEPAGGTTETLPKDRPVPEGR